MLLLFLARYWSIPNKEIDEKSLFQKFRSAGTFMLYRIVDESIFGVSFSLTGRGTLILFMVHDISLWTGMLLDPCIELRTREAFYAGSIQGLLREFLISIWLIELFYSYSIFHWQLRSERFIRCTMASSPRAQTRAFSLRAMLLKTGRLLVEFEEFSWEVNCVFAIFPLGAAIQDGGTKERGNHDHSHVASP